ncbi:Uncharacterized protein AC499_2568 [Pseudomonas amygdali pv. lachrymans]|uniref:Uncharacterized protein n=1 Tax=Pseudomonas amygdali pv. lachrymans TaxID=53707 RepID=A0ABR5KZI6_PSEAV|nr:Uncharacterized protein AC499_2568 [Pseudomonas amygdali pv. lachrymans]
MAALTMFETEMNAFFLAQALQQVQIAFVVLDMQRSCRVKTVHVLEPVSVCSNAVYFKQLSDQLRRRNILIDASAPMGGKLAKAGHQDQVIKAHTNPAVDSGRMADLAMHAAATLTESQKRFSVQQAAHIQKRVADQPDIEAIRFIESITAGEADDMQIRLAVGNRQYDWHLQVLAHLRGSLPSKSGCAGYGIPWPKSIAARFFGKRLQAVMESG